MTRQSMGGAPILLALLACVPLCCHVLGHPNEQPSDEITLERKQIFVNLENGTTFSLMVELSDAVQDLWKDIYEYEGVPGYEKRLQLGNAVLDYSTNLSDYNIQAGTELTLVIPEDQHREAGEFFVRTLDGQTLCVQTQLGNSVSSLKNNITQWTGIPQLEQRLLLGGKELKDERKLVHYAIYNHTKLLLGGPLENCRQVVTIFVATLSGATIELEVDLADSVADLKEKICAETGVPVGVQRLSDGERVIAGEDHLCDLGLDAGSTVYMWFYSSRVTSLDQVARLREPPGASFCGPHRAPIFQEAGYEAEAVGSRRHFARIYKDARNWVAGYSPRPGWDLDLFDPVAHLSPNPDSGALMEQYRRYLEDYPRPGASEQDRLRAEIDRARMKLSLAVRPYRMAANLTTVNHNGRQVPGITLGGGFSRASPKQPVPLGADVNNWAPDAISDSDTMRLFEVSARVRRVLARAVQAGEGILSIASQKQINRAILLTYLEALAGYPRPVVYSQVREDEECAICRDDLTAEPAVKLACEHAFHADCIQSWATDSYRWNRFPRCPYCRQRFMFPYETLGRVELAKPELQGNRDD